MRNEFAQAVIDLKDKNDALVFLTGDLGYLSLEKVQERFGEHFINAGVAEQNMVTVAAEQVVQTGCRCGAGAPQAG